MVKRLPTNVLFLHIPYVFDIFNPNVSKLKRGQTKALSNRGDYLDAWQIVPVLNKPVEKPNVHIKTGKG